MNNLPSDAETVAALSELRDRIKVRRARLSSLSAAEGGDGEGLSVLRQNVDEVNNLWFVNASLPIASKVPGVGTVLAYLKKIVRRLLRWYIDPLVEQQNRFNGATASSLVELVAHHESLRRDRAVLDERMQRIEKKLFATDQEPR